MLRHWIAGAAALLATSAASAQGPANWSGFYVGAEGGGANARLKVSGTDFIFQLSNEHPAAPRQPSMPRLPSSTSG